MGSAPARALKFEDFVLDLSRGCLMRGEAEIELRPKSFDLLQTFAENPSRLLSKDELLCAVWPNVTVTEDVLTHCISEVRRALDDRERKIIKTIPKRGYLFAATVYPREMRSAPRVPPAVAKTRVRRDARPGGRGRMLASGPAAPQGNEHSNPATDLPAPITDRPSLAVLPFENLSEDRTLGLVADGLVEDIITLLARVPGFLVLGRGEPALPFPHDARAISLASGNPPGDIGVPAAARNAPICELVALELGPLRLGNPCGNCRHNGYDSKSKRFAAHENSCNYSSAQSRVPDVAGAILAAYPANRHVAQETL